MTTEFVKKHAGKLVPATIMLALITAVMISRPAGEWLEPRLVSAQVAPATWTAVGASGTVDESSIASFGFTNASAGYSASTTSVSPLEFRYNVTNTYDNAANPNIPGWTRLELGATAPATSLVTASLYRVARCTGARKLICQVRVTNSSAGVCRVCTFANTAVNFTTDLYYVDATVDRGTVSEVPQLHTLRIF